VISGLQHSALESRRLHCSAERNRTDVSLTNKEKVDGNCFFVNLFQLFFHSSGHILTRVQKIRVFGSKKLKVLKCQMFCLPL
jgi:hypothetical protein